MSKLAQRSERVKSVDLHPTEPWILASLYSGTVCIWNYQTQTMVKSFEVTELPVRSAKFISRKQWVVAGADDMYTRVYNYNTMDKVKVLRSIQIISGSEDGTVRIWHSTTYRVVIGYDEGTIMVKLGREVLVASMDNRGKIIWSKHNEIQTVNIKSVGADYDLADGERLPLAVKELGTCDLYPQRW